MNKEYINPIKTLRCQVCNLPPETFDTTGDAVYDAMVWERSSHAVCCIMHIQDGVFNIPVCHDCGCKSEAALLRAIGVTPESGTPGDPEKCTWSTGCFSHKLGKCLLNSTPERCDYVR